MPRANTNRDKVVFIISTPLHLFHAIAASISECKGQESVLIFIDQPVGKENLYISTLKSWSGDPFSDHHIFYAYPRNASNKYSYRKQVLREIAALIGEIKPVKMYTGNDRRIEFIRAYKKMKAINPDAESVYLDDGVMSYVVHKYTWESPPEIFFKKLYYGFWYNRFPIVGASDFINSAVLAFPEEAHEYLRRLPIRPSNNQVLIGDDARKFSALLVEKFGISSALIDSLDFIQILPHRKELRKFRTFFADLRDYLIQTANSGKIIGIKYHPFEKEDFLDFSGQENIRILPPDIAFEAILPSMNDHSAVVGDLSTVLLTAKWLRPNLDIVSIQNPEDHRYNKILPLMKDLGIRIIPTARDYFSTMPGQGKP